MEDQLIKQGFGFAIYPSVKLKGQKKNKKTNKMSFGFLKEIIFGDYIEIFKENGKLVEKKVGSKTYIKVRARNRNGFILPNEIQLKRILEVNFIDVGQGDGCHVVTPNDEHFIIDAGDKDNTYRFLKWRFNLGKSSSNLPKFTAIISHSDQDHYRGFTKLFTHQTGNKNQIKFDKIYHNGMVEESGGDYNSLGTLISKGGEEYITDLVTTNNEYNKRSKKAQKKGNYIKLLDKSKSPKISLKYGSPSIFNTGNCKIEVIGPVVKKLDKKDALPVLGSNKGKTKNGHSIILKLTIGNLKVLLGGDLNSLSEDYLFQSFTGYNVEELKRLVKDPKSTASEKKKALKDIELAIDKMRNTFEVDIAKSCHHGSSDFTIDFLKALNPIATIISSGDEESHSHPRPDTLGTIGKHSRGSRSLIFSTELARSSKEFIELSDLSPTKKKERVVTTYGMINVRSDGEKVIITQKLEKARNNKNWDIYKLEWNNKMGEFEYKK